jgi:predicted nucleotidyltransferase
VDKGAALAYARQYAAEVTKELKPELIVMYGSYAADNANNDSDIDVAVIFNGFDGDFLRVSSRLWDLTWKVSSYIEPILLDKTNDKSGFVAQILKTGKLIYQE